MLRKIPLFGSVEVLEPYIESGRIYARRYAGGTTVHAHRDVCKTLDVVFRGSLVAYSLAENGSARSIFEFSEGGILGANLLFAEDCRYPLNIYCLSDCELIHISKSAVEDLLRHHDFVMRYIESLSRNSQGLNQKMAMFTQKTLRENILDYLRQQSALQRSRTVRLPISKKELADYLGVQRPSLFRELKRMKDERILDIRNRTIIIHGPSPGERLRGE